jgi:hypothetical protein
MQFGVGVLYKMLYSRRDSKVINTHTSGLKSISFQWQLFLTERRKVFHLSDDHTSLKDAEYFVLVTVIPDFRT